MADSNSAGSRRPAYPAGTIAKVSTDILNETFHNIIHDLVAKVHREEKVARMRSAAVVARQKAEEEATVPDEAASKTAGDAKKEVVIDPHKLATVRLETNAAIFEHGKVYLKGNPLHTVTEIICPDCRLPRLLYPSIGDGSHPPPNPNREYCLNGPMITLPGHDVHGKLFAVMPNPKKKKTEKDLSIPEIPTTKCPICPRYFVMNRLAQHLDRCMNISGRGTSTRNKTPTDSGASSPTSSAPKRPHADEDDGSPSPTKKKKLGAPKKGATSKPGPSKLKNSFTVEDNDDDVKSENADA